jgi:hypothetical protein
MYALKFYTGNKKIAREKSDFYALDGGRYALKWKFSPKTSPAIIVNVSNFDTRKRCC